MSAITKLNELDACTYSFDGRLKMEKIRAAAQLEIKKLQSLLDNSLRIVTHEKFYEVIHVGGTREIVRRDVYWDSNWKCPKQIKRINEIEVLL